MALLALGNKISGALKKLNQSNSVDENTLKECLNEITKALLGADVKFQIVRGITENIKMQFKLNEEKGINLKRLIQSEVVKELTKMLETEKKPFVPKKGKSNVIMFVGLQGNGKTTSCVKYAYFWNRKGWRTALVCADTFRAGAFDQLKQNARKTGIPHYGSYTEDDPAVIAQQGVDIFKKEGFEIIIVDTSGRHSQETALFQEMKQIEAAVEPDETIFVMDGSLGQSCYDQALAFSKAVRLGSVLVTKLDGSAKGGGALSAVAATRCPISYIGTGEHFDAFEKFEPATFIKRLLGLGDLSKIFEVVQEAMPAKDQESLIEMLMKGDFTYRKLQTQYKTFLKLGNISQFMSYLPGVGQNLQGKINEKEAVAKIKRFLSILDSMTSDELDGKKELDLSRKTRIARGSGTSLPEMDLLVDEHKRIAKMMKQLSKVGLGNKGGDMRQMMNNNPMQMLNKLKGAIDPKIMSQLGGPENMKNMMKELAGMEKNGQFDFGEMAKMMGSGGLGGMGMPGAARGKRRK
jgi:signal recognition particle subunit SRP54